MKQLDVLIIEDSIFSADLNVRELKKAGFNIYYQIVASKKALQKALREKHWDIILSDNNMGGFDALQALEVKNQEHCHTPFVIVSEDMLERDVKTAINGGCRAYISKEYLGNLGQQVKEIIENPNA